MSEELDLPALPRGTLLDVAGRIMRFDAALPQLRAIVAGERDAVALQASLACVLWQVFAQANWCGFYRRVEDQRLAVGPYQGGLGCLSIPLSRGVCGAAARTGEIQRVPDVTQFPGHIACDAQTRSEIVVPVFAGARVMAVLDLDSPHLDGFSPAEATRLDALLRQVFGPDTVW